MTVNISFASSDGYLTSSSANYTTAQNGNAIAQNTAGTQLRVGQNKVGATYEIYQAFMQFPNVLDSNVVIVSAYFDLYQESVLGTGTARDMGLRSTAWGTLDAGDWKTPSAMGALDRYGLAGGVQTGGGKHVYLAEENLNNAMSLGGTVQVVAYTSRFTGSDIPTGAEYSVISSSEASGTAQDPCLVWTTIPIHQLIRVGACHVQLSDGRHVYLEADTGGAEPAVVLKWRDGTTVANLASNMLSTTRGFGSSNQGMQSVALCRDAEDNLYIISHAAGAGNNLNVVAWEKIGLSVWAERTNLQASMPASDGVINNLVAAWHNVGTEGTILVIGSHEPNAVGSNPTNQVFFALLNCANLLNGTGNLLRGSGDAYPSLVSSASQSTDHNNFINEVGSCLDIAALDATRGVVVSQSRAAGVGDYAPVSIVRYVLNSTGTAISDVDGGVAFPVELWGTKDATAKVRVIPISSTQFVVVTLDRDSGWGPRICVFQNFGTSATFSELGGFLLHGEGIASLPAPSAMDTTFAWDAIYQPVSNKVWFYYFDTANGQRLMRTAIDLNTYQAVKNEIQVSASIGAAGSTNHAIRVQRGLLTESEVLITSANRSSGGVQSTIYVVDKLNDPPTAPILADQRNYDATSSDIFTWTFRDPNTGDTQTAYEMQIDNADTLASVVATGKVVSTTSARTVAGNTLTNGVNYRWRVRTWDTSDEVGAWSGYDFFSTAAGGTVNITAPSSDNLAGLVDDSYTVQWSVAGTTQDAYKVRVIRTSDASVLSDSGWVTSTATSRVISGLLSDVEYRIEVTVRNSSLIETNTATRLITVDYNDPETPLVTVTSDDGAGRIFVFIVNPAPTGDRPEATENRVERRVAGTSDWTAIARIVTNGSYEDFNVASNVLYEYRVVGVGATGESASLVQEGRLSLMGVWLHSPTDSTGTARNYLYGKDQRGASHESFSELNYYAGREDPVADFAEYHSQTFRVTVDIPFGDTWRDDVDHMYELEHSHGTLVYRDNRGRFAFGIMTGLNETDTALGTQMSFDFTKVSYNESIT